MQMLLRSWHLPSGNINTGMFHFFYEAVCLFVTNKPGLDFSAILAEFTHLLTAPSLLVGSISLQPSFDSHLKYFVRIYRIYSRV